MKTLTRGGRVVAFIERYCMIPSGSKVGQSIKLLPFQKKFILDVYDNPHSTRRGYLSIARKNGKTALIACLALAHLVGPEAKRNAQIISGAMSREQAAIVYDLASKIVALSPELRGLVREVPSAKRLLGLPLNTEYRATSAEAKTAHGLSPILAILDEVGQIRGPQSDFVDAITTSQGAHDAPLLLAISTQAPNDNDLFSIWLDDAKASKDKRIVCHLYEAPKECTLLDKAAWKAANPAIGKFRSTADMREQAERADRMPSSEPTFRNLGLNQRVEMFAPFISPSVWLANAGPIDEAVFREEDVYVGIDLSAKTDLTAMVMVACRDEKWHVKCIFWTPADGLKERSQRDRAPYDVWERQGFIRAIPGTAIDYEDVARDIADTLSDCRSVRAVGFDRWRFDLLKKELDEIGVTVPLVPFGQGFKDMAPAMERVEGAMLNETVFHGANPVLTMCMNNARVESSPTGDRKLNKAKATGRIDGAVALVMAMGVIPMSGDDPMKSYLAFLDEQMAVPA